MPHYSKQQQAKNWSPAPFILASERKILVLGLGKLGALSANRLLDNGFNVKGWSRTAKPSTFPLETLSGAEGLNEGLGWADIVIVLLPLTHETNGLLGNEQLCMMKKGASIINFGRGPVIDKPALIKVLDGHLAHAVLDVFDQEPLPQTDPLWSLDNVTILPHISAPTHVGTAAKIVSDNVNLFFESGIIPQSVDRCLGC